MSDDLYEPWQKLIRLLVLGKVIEVPEKNILLRQFQYVAPDIGMGRYCWNGECRYFLAVDEAREHDLVGPRGPLQPVERARPRAAGRGMTRVRRPAA
jgi:hypothetical protein